jgi:hypothetical protein
MPKPKIDRSGEVPVYTVEKMLTDEETQEKLSKFLSEDDFPTVITEDADVYNTDGELLLRFRKNVLDEKIIDTAYEAMKDFIKNVTTDRGVASGSEKGLETGGKKPVMSNIMGYFDKWSISQRATFKRTGVKSPGPCRLCSFNAKNPEKWKHVVPLIQEIDKQYRKLCPKEYESQRKAAKSTPFHVKGTAFSTLTTNLNFRTAVHTDKGDWPTGFGNLVVIERGSKYKGSYTGFPQYGVAVDCRNGDFLAMDVHLPHGNTPLIKTDETSQRISLVSYLRERIVEKGKGQKMYDPQDLEKKIDNKKRTLKATS